MLSRNNSYFDPVLCGDGHYIITGRTNDRFCLDTLEITDILPALHRYLIYEQRFDAVIIFDNTNILYCLDRQSFAILTHLPESRPEEGGDEISRQGPMGARRRRRAPAQDDPAPARNAGQRLNLGRMSMDAAWQQVSGVMKHSRRRCALVIANATVMEGGTTLMTELNSFSSTNHSVVISLFRETTISNVREWTNFARSVLEPRISTADPEQNRVISLPAPNCREIRNLLNHFRMEDTPQVRVDPGSIRELGDLLAASCARNGWGLTGLIDRLCEYAAAHPGVALTGQNWREFTGETAWRPALEELNALVGQQRIKDQINAWLADRQRHAEARTEPVSSSRFAPLPAYNRRRGFSLNIRLKGGSGSGKSTIAKLIGRIYYDLGLLPQSRPVECSAAELVSGFVGHTREQVRQRVQEAMGGVLFIDEAYALMDDEHGLEAINQLVHDISAYEGQFAVILAGYSAQIDRLMRTNEGLASRFPNEYVLDDYTPAQMRQIFEQMVSREDPPVVVSPSLEARFEDFFESWVGGRGEGWGNARECRNLLDEMKKLCSLREAAEHVRGREYCLTEADVPERLRYCLEPRSKGPIEAMQRIDKMTGLDGVKNFLRRLVQRTLLGEKEQGAGNFIFFGPPGTGKTTIARRMGELLRLLHVLERDHVTECKAADLLSGKLDLNDQVQSARRGVFFLDEAHQLVKSDQGRAIIRALVPLVEDPEIRADTCFICACYADELDGFLAVDPGLERRFPPQNRIRFYDYTAEELVEILEKKARERGQDPTPEYLERALAALDAYMPYRPNNFGNGGFIRDNFLPGSITARTIRLNIQMTGSPDAIPTEAQLNTVPPEDRRRLTKQDLPEQFARLAGPPGRPLVRRTALQRVEELLGKEEIVNFARARARGDDEQTFADEQTHVGLHYAIVGPTGSGRHTAVRALAALWRELGLLERDDVVSAGYGDLIAKYLGHTTDKVAQVIRRAAGGTLLLEYPSSLLPKGEENSYGPEALGVIVSAMPAHADDTSFVLLDTPEGIEQLFKAQPSLRGQMSKIFVLDDLTPAQMQRLFEEKTRNNMGLEPELQDLMTDFFVNWVSDRGGLGDASRSWSNGMEIDRLIEELKINWKNASGESRTDTVEESGHSYTRVRRYIERQHFPEKMRRYLSQTTAVAGSAMKELDDLPGLRLVKRSIRGIRRRIRRLGRGNSKPGCYLYLGNPGVGKTTVARLMGRVLKAAGVLEQGHVIERTARQIGDQLKELDSAIKLARGGILFIDEAHQLAEPQNYWGNEVIKRLLNVLENDEITDTTCIILAGYPGPMMQLLQQDAGLASRFGSEDNIIRFEDYNADELMQVLDYMAARAHTIRAIGAVRPLQPDEGYRQASRRVFETVLARGDRNFGNARFVRSYLHDSLNAQLERMDEEYGEIDDPPIDEVDRLTEADVPARWRKAVSRPRERAACDPKRMNLKRGAEVTEMNYEQSCEQLSQSVVLLETWSGGRRTGTATGTIVTDDGLVLTCAHVVRGADAIRARVYTPGAVGGDTKWLDAEFLEPVCTDCDMAALRLPGKNFRPAALCEPDRMPRPGERTLILGYPLGDMISGGDTENLRISSFSGRVVSCQPVGAVTRCYVDSKGLHGNSGSPVISMEDQRVIGVFSGSIIPRQKGSLDELNYFYPLTYFWERFVPAPSSPEPDAQDKEGGTDDQN